MRTTMTWTGQCMTSASLLYESYLDLADVFLDGRRIGTVLHLADGYYKGSMDQISSGTKHATPDSAQREVVRLYKEFRA